MCLNKSKPFYSHPRCPSLRRTQSEGEDTNSLYIPRASHFPAIALFRSSKPSFVAVAQKALLTTDSVPPDFPRVRSNRPRIHVFRRRRAEQPVVFTVDAFAALTLHHAIDNHTHHKNNEDDADTELRRAGYTGEIGQDADTTVVHPEMQGGGALFSGRLRLRGGLLDDCCDDQGWRYWRTD